MEFEVHLEMRWKFRMEMHSRVKYLRITEWGMGFCMYIRPWTMVLGRNCSSPNMNVVIEHVSIH